MIRRVQSRVRPKAQSLVLAVLAAAMIALTVGCSGDVDTPNKAAEPGRYAVWLVDQALERYESEGREATIAHYNSPDSVDGPWYVFIIDGKGYTIGHPREEIRGRDPSLRVDTTGYFYGDDLLSATEEGRWVTYVFLNPATGQEELKHTWAVRHDGLLFATGWYERYIGAR